MKIQLMEIAQVHSRIIILLPMVMIKILLTNKKTITNYLQNLISNLNINISVNQRAIGLQNLFTAAKEGIEEILWQILCRIKNQKEKTLTN